MDSKKIGTFIANKRKEKQMTQKQLGEALGCSDKTISKWECGNGLPDASMMLPLCEQLEINVNELLSGEELPQEHYSRKAEENMMNLIKSNEDQKKKMARSVISGGVLTVGILIFLISLTMVNASTIPISFSIYLDGISILEVGLFTVLSLWYAGHLKDFKNAFVYLFFDTEDSRSLQDAIEAVTLAEKSLIVSGAFISIFYVIYLLSQIQALNGMDVFCGNMAVALITLLYGVFGAMLLIPMKSRLEKKL